MQFLAWEMSKRSLKQIYGILGLLFVIVAKEKW